MSAADDRFAIEQVVNNFAWAYDMANLDLIGTLFTDDAVMGLEIAGADPIPAFEGKEALMGLFKGALDEQNDQRRHVMTNFIVEEQSADAATVVSYLTLCATAEGTLNVLATGWYRDQLVKGADGSWKIKNRFLALDSPY